MKNQKGFFVACSLVKKGEQFNIKTKLHEYVINNVIINKSLNNEVLYTALRHLL